MLELHRLAMRHSVDVVGQIEDSHWDRATPCDQWRLRDLVHHMILENRGFAAAADGETADRTVWTEASFDDDLRADYRASAERVSAAFARDGVLDGEFWLPLIDDSRRFPARQAISFHLLDYVVHSWDVARAAGQPITFEPELVQAVAEIAEAEVPDGPRRRRPNASFRPPVTVEPGGREFDRVLAFLGRSPYWPYPT
jgi:uncharacterized protein (TIGR03086 family)